MLSNFFKKKKKSNFQKAYKYSQSINLNLIVHK